MQRAYANAVHDSGHDVGEEGKNDRHRRMFHEAEHCESFCAVRGQDRVDQGNDETHESDDLRVEVEDAVLFP